MEDLKEQKKYRQHPKRVDPLVESKIVLLKERKPSVTLSTVKKILKREGINISIKGIWSTWKRYGLAGFSKEKFSPSFLEYITKTPETHSGIYLEIEP